MAERSIENIEGLGDESDAASKATSRQASSGPKAEAAGSIGSKVSDVSSTSRTATTKTSLSSHVVSVPDPVDINYPDPTPLSTIVRDVARWSGRSFVMEPGTNTKLQIFAPRKMPPHKAYDLFLTSLSVVSLRAVQVGEVIKIVPVQGIVVA